MSYGLPLTLFEVLPRRWVAERTWAWLVNHRRLRIDYERDPAVTAGSVWAAHTRTLLRRLTQTPRQPTNSTNQHDSFLGRTLGKWKTQISNWHAARVTNAPTEAANNLMKRVKRAAFGFKNFANYRIRALLYAGKPNWELLDSLTLA